MAYGPGLVVDGKQLAKVAIIDLRGNQNPAAIFTPTGAAGVSVNGSTTPTVIMAIR